MLLPKAAQPRRRAIVEIGLWIIIIVVVVVCCCCIFMSPPRRPKPQSSRIRAQQFALTEAALALEYRNG